MRAHPGWGMASSMRLAGVRYPLTSHPAINSGQHLQPEVMRIRFHAEKAPCRSNLAQPAAVGSAERTAKLPILQHSHCFELQLPYPLVRELKLVAELGKCSWILFIKAVTTH